MIDIKSVLNDRSLKPSGAKLVLLYMYASADKEKMEFKGTAKEIGELLGYKKSAVRGYLRILEDRGIIDRSFNYRKVKLNVTKAALPKEGGGAV